MKKYILALCASVALAAPAAAGTVDFEDLGVAPGTQINPAPGVSQDSGGFTFTPGPSNIAINDLHFHNQNGVGDNGSTHLGTHDDVVMTRVGGGVFSLQSFQYNHFGTPFDFTVTGELSGGGNLFVQLSSDADANSYETFNLIGWNDLVSVTFFKTGDQEFGFFLDNLVFDDAAVPEPATWALMIGGFGLAGAALRRRRALTA